jgi:hypothetical protein
MARSGLTCGLLRPSLKVLGVRSQADLATGRPGWDCWMTVNGAERKLMLTSPASGFAPQPTFDARNRNVSVGWTAVLPVTSDANQSCQSCPLETDPVSQRGFFFSSSISRALR